SHFRDGTGRRYRSTRSSANFAASAARQRRTDPANARRMPSPRNEERIGQNSSAWRAAVDEPKSDRLLALRELCRAACLAQADLLALDLAGIAGNEACATQRLPQRFVVFDQRSRDTVANRTGLAGGAAARHGCVHIESTFEVARPE